MPILLADAKIGTIVKPPKNAYMCGNALFMVWERNYVVSHQDRPYTWLIIEGKPMAKYHAMSTLRQWGTFQCRDSEVFLLPSDPRPTDKSRLVSEEARSDEDKPKKPRGGFDVNAYSFAFDDDEITLTDLPRQAQIVADILLDASRVRKTSTFSEKEIDEILSDPKSVEMLATRQPPLRIFQFYRSKFAQKGLLKKT